MSKTAIRAVRTFVYKKRHRSGTVTWVVRWKHPETAQWFNVPGGRSRDEAEELEDQVRQKLRRGEIPRAEAEALKPMRVGELIDLFYQSPRFLGGAEKWRANRRGQFENVIRPELGNVFFASLTKDRVLRFYLKLKEQGLSNSTIKKYHMNLAGIGQLFQELNPGHANPLDQIRDFRRLFPKQAPTRDIDFLTEEELELIFAELRKCRASTILPAIQFLAYSGLRRSEALELQWKDIDLAHGYIQVRRSKNGSARRVPLEAMSREALAMLPRVSDHVFTSSRGEPYHPDSLIKPLKSAAESAGIEKRVDIHMLRHSYGSNKIRAGWGLKKVSVLLGHKDIQITANVYTHLLDGDLRVRDEYRGNGFARDEAEAAEYTGPAEERVAAAVKSLIRELEKTPTEACRQPDFALAVQNAVAAALTGGESNHAAEAAPRAKCSETDPNAAKLRVLTTSAETGHNVPQMFRNSLSTQPDKGAENEKAPDTSSVPGPCSKLKMADPTGLEPVTFRSVV